MSASSGRCLPPREVPYPLHNEDFGKFIDKVRRNGFGVHIGVHVRGKVRKREANW